MAYTTINGCSHKPSILSVLTLLLYIAIIALHSIYVIPGVIAIDHPILWVIFAMFYLLIVLIIYDYIWIMVHDPVDRVVLDPELANKYEIDQLQDCSKCGKRKIGSHHCSICGRCTQEYDHHCKFLNNCIGRYNYEAFLRLICINILLHLNLIGQCIWVFVSAVNSDSIKQAIPPSYWVIIGLIAMSAILLVLLVVLLSFHCYISCCLNLTTIDFIFQKQQDSENTNKNEPVQRRKDPSGSERALR